MAGTRGYFDSGSRCLNGTQKFSSKARPPSTKSGIERRLERELVKAAAEFLRGRSRTENI
jgi:hypothetical protein